MHELEAALAALRSGDRVALVLVVGVRGSTPRVAGSRMVVFADGHHIGTIGGGTVEYKVTKRAIEVIRTGRPERIDVHLTRDLGMCCGGEMSVYIEPLLPHVPLVIFGAGHVARALAPMANALDFDLTVVDDRDELNHPDRFPGVSRVVEDARTFAASLAPDPSRYVLIVTHDHLLDQDLCELLLPQPSAWIGMIGSRAKVAKFFVRLRAAGMDPTLFEKLSAPVGLDLGAQTPAEIAVAIAAEFVRVRRHADRAPLPLSCDPIPARGGPARPPSWAHQAD